MVYKCFQKHRESSRQEDLERLLNRVECVVLNYPPVANTNVVANAAVEFLQNVSPIIAFVTEAGYTSLYTPPLSLYLTLSYTHQMKLHTCIMHIEYIH